ncbi:hypothetical protein AAG906_020591 [Vitis piasezkii]
MCFHHRYFCAKIKEAVCFTLLCFQASEEAPTHTTIPINGTLEWFHLQSHSSENLTIGSALKEFVAFPSWEGLLTPRDRPCGLAKLQELRHSYLKCFLKCWCTRGLHVGSQQWSNHSKI